MRALVAAAAALLPLAAAHAFELASPERAATILVLPSEPECVRLAAHDLASDTEKISGRRPAVVASLDQCSADCVVVGSVSRTESAALLARFSPKLAPALEGKWEAWRVETVAGRVGPIERALVIAGSDARGAMFALYALIERHLGVDPLYFWADRPPPRRERLAWDSVRLAADEPTFRYRGWFLNDEDLLCEWHLDGGRRDIAYPYYAHVTSPKVSARVFEAMVRLGFNIVIPASFVDIRNPAEERLVADAARRGLFVSQHHIEPLGVSGYGFANYWRDKGRTVPFSFVRHRKEFEAIWRDYAARWARHPNVVWQLGLRGIADRPVWASDPSVPKSPAERGKLISEAIALQWQIVRSIDRRPNPPATATLWMEGSALHQEGHLSFPPGVTVVFADNSPGWQLQADFHQVAREPGRPYGIYYHMALWGSGPHLVQGVSPARAHGIFKLAVERGSTAYAILNVANVREFALGLDAASRFLRDFASFRPDAFLSQWCQARFSEAAPAAEQCYRRLFESYVADPRTGRRRMLDGELLHAGVRFYGRMLTVAKQGTKPPWQKPEQIRKLLARVQTQRAAIEKAGEGAQSVVERLDGHARTFFQTNFVAQQRILLGLARWLESGLLAGLALQDDDGGEFLARLTAADEAVRLIRSGQALASRGKWEHWYRGDRKMNLGFAEMLTKQLLSDARKRPVKSLP